MNQQDLDNLLSYLKAGTCAIILGPEFFLLENGKENEIQCLRDTISKERLKTSPYFQEDGFFYTGSDTDGITNKNAILRVISDYYSELPVPKFYDELSKLPFYLVISLSPDDLLAKAMNSIGRPYTFAYYKVGEGLCNATKGIDGVHDPFKIDDIKPIPASNCPLIFNFQGIYYENPSMIFTHDSLFDFLYYIFPVDKFPLTLKKALDKASAFLFLGFEYDKWYLKLIFFILTKLIGEKRPERKAIFSKESEIVDFYKTHFHLKFFKEDTLSFLRTLYEDCEKKGILQPKVIQVDSGRSDPFKPPPKYKVLYFSSNSEALIPLDSDTEFNKIQQAWLDKPDRGNFEAPKYFGAVTQSQFFKKIDQEKPNLVVISAHGVKEGLKFKAENGEPIPYALDDFLDSLRTLTQDHANRLQCIIFSCCNSKELANKTAEKIPYSIGMEGPIQDEAMPVFSDGFFSSFFNNGQIPHAFEMGKREVRSSNDVKPNTDRIFFFSKQKIE